MALVESTQLRGSGLSLGSQLAVHAHGAVVALRQEHALVPTVGEAQCVRHPGRERTRKQFARDGARTVRADVPENLWTCAGAFNAEAVALLRGARP